LVTNPTPTVISGSIAIDRIMSFAGQYRDHLQPDKLDSLSISLFLDQLHDSHGGVGANIAYSLALLGEEPHLLGSVGPDAALYLEKLARCGVNIKYIHESQLPTASFNVMTDSNQNQIGGFYPGAMFDSDSLTLEPWRESEAIIVVSPHDPKAMRRQVAQCRQWNLRLCYDVGQQVSNLSAGEMAEGVAAAEVLIMNDYEMSALAKKLGRSLADIKADVPVVVTTLGQEGSVIEGASVPAPIRVGVAAVQQVADPTGAGDAYRAGFLYGLARKGDLRTCARLGAVCAAYAVEQLGTQTHAFTLETVAQRFEATFKETIWQILKPRPITK
jgi:adenosine kinase